MVKVLGPMQVFASSFLMTLIEFSPNQQPGDWSLETLGKQSKGMTVGGE
jgi:hypothetical protein